MSTGSYEENSLGWQLSLLRRRGGEWWELQTNRIADNIPDVPELSWLDSPMIQAIAKSLFWLLVALLVVWTAWQIWQVLSPYLYILRQKLGQPRDTTVTKPSQELSVKGWLARSRLFQREGNYREACLCLYLAMLQRLHDREIILHQASRTDGEYLNLVRDLPQPQPYQTIFTSHQQLLFAGREATAQLYDRIQQAYQDLDLEAEKK
ncbi:MAG: DUF4129 domain-containing protein [Oscillatoria sp. PMC 1051.18]|nr:DUF4129 domain-containing protein [Oscillatoria sp. PMC 1050.18]MEC5029679.1 DUF4129 domain-containing protein [Oscillatoria sp. PMC 1051.18]